MATLPWGLQVTQDGKPLPDQSLGLRLFKDMADAGERYRLVMRNGKWIAYHNGRRIVDTIIMQRGAVSVGVLIDEIMRVRNGW